MLYNVKEFHNHKLVVMMMMIMMTMMNQIHQIKLVISNSNRLIIKYQIQLTKHKILRNNKKNQI